MIRALARWIRALLAAGALAIFIVGVPGLLVVTAGWPLRWLGWTRPTVVPRVADLVSALTSPWSDSMIFAVLATGGWLLWALFLRDVLVEVIAACAEASQLRAGRGIPNAARRGPMRAVAAVLIGAIIGAILADSLRGALGSPAASAAAADAAAHRPAVAVALARPVSEPLTDPLATPVQRSTIRVTPAALTVSITTSPDVPAWAADAPGGVHHVVKGDNLWDIAEAKLGDPYRWREIYHLNRGQPQAGGYRLTDPDEIDIGWVLALPARDPAAASPAAAQPPAAEPASPSSATSASPPADASATPFPSASASPTPQPTPTASVSSAPGDHHDQHSDHGVRLPSQGWVSLGLATTIAAVAALLRLHARRRACLTFPIPTRTGPTRSPIPARLAPAEAAGTRLLDHTGDPADPMTALVPDPPSVPAPVGVTGDGAEASLFTVPGTGIALCGDGAEAAVRAVLAAALATGVLDPPHTRPIVAISRSLLARLLPPDVPPVGLDPDHDTFDGERLIVLADPAAAVTHAEEELFSRRRLLDAFDEPSVAALNARTDHAEYQPPYVLLVEAVPRHAARIAAVAAHRHTLDLHPVTLGENAELTAHTLRSDGTTDTSDAAGEPAAPSRWATLAADDLAPLLVMVADTAARPEAGTAAATDNSREPTADTADPAETTGGGPELIEVVPQRDTDAQTPAPVRLRVLGPVRVDTAAGAVTSGLRTGSNAVLALLAAHPAGRTLAQITEAVYPDDADTEPAANRVRSDITTLRRTLRAATGEAKGWFVLYAQATGLYRLDPDTVDVDLWQMLAALTRANLASDDPACLTALEQAVSLYGGPFADGIDQPWSSDYATTYRHQILAAFARVAEICEADRPDQAVAALESAIALDPVNEELYQRLMRIHGRLGRPDAVRRALRQLEARLADLGAAEPSEATRRVAARQLRPAAPAAPAGGARR